MCRDFWKCDNPRVGSSDHHLLMIRDRFSCLHRIEVVPLFRKSKMYIRSSEDRIEVISLLFSIESWISSNIFRCSEKIEDFFFGHSFFLISSSYIESCFSETSHIALTASRFQFIKSGDDMFYIEKLCPLDISDTEEGFCFFFTDIMFEGEKEITFSKIWKYILSTQIFIRTTRRYIEKCLFHRFFDLMNSSFEGFRIRDDTIYFPIHEFDIFHKTHKFLD